MRFFYVCIIAGMLAGCGLFHEGGRVPLSEALIDPEDRVLKQSVAEILKKTGAPVSSSYSFYRLDLEGDGRRDALVLFELPYGHWCDINGCTVLVMKAHNTGFTVVNAIHPVREPLYISAHKTQGWSDIIVRVSGRWDRAKNVVLSFDGDRYPENPEVLPPCGEEFRGSAVRIFYQ